MQTPSLKFAVANIAGWYERIVGYNPMAEDPQLSPRELADLTSEVFETYDLGMTADLRDSIQMVRAA